MHPKDKYERRQIESSAKVLQSRLFRQRKINSKKRKLKTEIEDQETQDELRRASRTDVLQGTDL